MQCSVLPLYQIPGLCNYITQLFLSMLCSLSSPSSDKALRATRISECLADVSTWTHPLRLKLNKTELLLMPGKDCPHMDLLVTVERSLYLLLQLPETSVWYWTISYAAPQTSLRWMNPALPHKGSSSASSPITGHLPPRLLQLTPGWTSCLCD